MHERSVGQGTDHRIVIIGAGFSGIGAAIKLKGAGIDDFVVLDKDAEVGGTWRANVYPGVACDVPILAYEYGFEPNPDWSQLFASGAEIQSYALHCVDKYGVRPHFRPSTEVRSLRFEPEHDRWMVMTSRGTMTARFVLYAPGVLAIPKRPAVPGLDDFQGAMCHTARWSVGESLGGRRVGVIGTGASAMQIIPEVARKAGHLHVFQRTPIWVLPRVNPRFPPWLQTTFRRVPATRSLLRTLLRGCWEAFAALAVLQYGRLPWVGRWMERACVWHLRRQVPDGPLRERLTPRYPFGCKRMSFSNEYLPTFTQDHVELVTEGIERVTPGGVVTAVGREIELDTIILATGFEVFEPHSSPAFDIEGVDGVDLRSHWKAHRYQAYEGVTVPGFPNLFLLPGPYGVVGAYFVNIEATANHALRCIEEAERRHATRVEVRQAASDAFFEEVRRRRRTMVFFAANCSSANSYYFDHNGDAPLIRPQTATGMWWRSKRFPLDDYEFTSAAAPTRHT